MKVSTALGNRTWSVELFLFESVGLESGSFVCRAVVKSLLPFLVESLDGRNGVKVSTAAAVNFAASESTRRRVFVLLLFFFFFSGVDALPR